MQVDDLDADQTEALIHRVGGLRGVEKLLSGEWVVGEPGDVLEAPREVVDDLLGVGAPVAVPGTERFVVRETFVVNRDGELPISYIGEDFASHFLDLVEEAVPATVLRPCTLLKGSVDGPIFAALGGEGSARVALAQAHAFLKQADRTRWFFFYVADVRGALWAMDTYWRDGGWDLEVYSITYPRGWRGGGRVVARGRSDDAE
ncbi:hypothetical protein [Sphingomonas sp.]|uniref:hypothetical protein n=1 Tax=Sphingomonas sp. TaxID=28214 RepID=UPI001B03051F|nr:hypothetical protein [Sphingomonas sp.]MBO9714598.1 hypothetical protein [Sphingomonas sp.]